MAPLNTSPTADANDNPAYSGRVTFTMPIQLTRTVVAVAVKSCTALVAVLLWLVLAGPTLAAPAFPSLTGRVVDNAGFLDAATAAQIATTLEAHENSTGNQVVVATVNDLQGYDIADFAVRLGRHWQLGQAERDNGVLLLVAKDEKKMRIEVGYGLEGALTDALSSTIIRREMRPAFREGDFNTGIQRGVTAIIQAIEGEYSAPAETGSDSSEIEGYFPLLFIGLIGLFEMLKRFGHRQLGNTAFPAAFAGIAVTAISQNLLFGLGAAVVVFLLMYFVVKPGGGSGGGTGTPGARRGGYRGGFGGGGFSGGGGFGGGGGSFGGGGASGGW